MIFRNIGFRDYIAVAVISLSSVTFSMGAQAESLQEALISAYQNHPRLQAARAQLRELDENYVLARAQGSLKSSLSGNAAISVNRTPSLTIPIEGFDSFVTSGTSWSTPTAAQLQFIQPIYQGGRVSALKSQARSGILAAREGLRSTETELFVDAANAYVDVIRDEEAARIRRLNVQVLMRQKEAADSRFELGAGTRTDVALAESRLAGAKIGLAQADSVLQISRAKFREATGHLPENLEPLPRFSMPGTEIESVSLARDNNPALLAARYNEEAGDAAIKAAKSAGKPVVSLTGNLGGTALQGSFPQTAQSASIGAQVTIPLITGGVNRSGIRSAENARTRLMLEARDAERRIDGLIMQAWARKTAAEKMLRASQVQISASEIALEGVQLEREVGTRNALDVLNAEQELLEAKLRVINSRSDVEKANYGILALTGGFDAVSLNLATIYYDPEDNFQDVTSDGIIDVIEDIIPAKWR